MQPVQTLAQSLRTSFDQMAEVVRRITVRRAISDLCDDAM